jgi:prolyl-tRNA synthetase
MFAQWIRSWRDLPMKINQWANVVRWEMRTRPFLRTTEFHWQEGHTAHETLEEAEAEVLTMLNEYVNLCQNFLAIPVVTGRKSKGEQFPGADKTMTFEGLMPDGKALQMGTSHLISQSFAKAFNMQFQNREGTLSYPFLTSWGATTRLIGALVMTHGDEKGLILPPKVAPIQVIIVPILVGPDTAVVIEKAQAVAQELKNVGIKVFVDADTEKTPGAKFFAAELKGIPLRLEIGPRDIAKSQLVMADRLSGQKKTVSIETVVQEVQQGLEDLQKALFERAVQRRKHLWHREETLANISATIDDKPGFYQTGWCQMPACEAVLKEHKITIRCLLEEQTFANCYNCNMPSKGDVLLAKSY